MLLPFGCAALLTLLVADPLVLGTEARLRWVPALSPGLLRAWVTLLPGEPVGQYAEGLRYRSAGRRDEARAAFERAYRIDPEFIPARAYLAEQLLDRGNGSAAYELTQKCLDRDPTYAPALVVLGRLHAEREEWHKALQVVDAALAQASDSPEAWLLKARVNAERADWSDCRAAAERALRLRPSLAEAWILVARSCGQQGDSGGALSAARRATDLQPHSSEARAYLGQALLTERAHADAERVLRGIRGSEPGGDLAAVGLAQVLYARGQIKGALRQAAYVVREWPLQNVARRVLADSHARLGDAAAARRWRQEHQRWQDFLAEKARLERAQFGPSYHQQTHLQLARLCAEMGLWPEALRHGRLGLQRISQPAVRTFWDRLQQAHAVRDDPARRAGALRRLDAPLEQFGISIERR